MRPWIPLLFTLTACMVGDDDEDGDLVDTSQQYRSNATVPGANSDYCIASPYNCRFHAGDSRVVTKAGSESWGIEPGASIRDGNGTALKLETGSTLTFNFGQTRALAGKAHALALTTSNASAGWYPLDHIKGETSFREQVGEVNAKDPGQGKMACYRIKDAGDSSIELKKVVYDSQEPASGHERAGDYLPELRSNGKRSANLVFSVPGFGLGGATTDHFLAGTKFQRVDVPTDSGHPSISVPLWVKDSAGKYRKQSGTMRFLYGYVVSSADGAKRFGWMAQDSLEVSSACP